MYVKSQNKCKRKYIEEASKKCTPVQVHYSCLSTLIEISKKKEEENVHENSCCEGP